METNPRKVLHAMNNINQDNRTSPMKNYTDQEALKASIDQNHYDIQGYYKRINDMMAKQEDLGDINKKPLHTLSPHDPNSNNPLYLRVIFLLKTPSNHSLD